MNKYKILKVGVNKWILSPNNGREIVPALTDIVKELNKLLKERDNANARLRRLEIAGNQMLSGITRSEAERIWSEANNTKEAKP